LSVETFRDKSADQFPLDSPRIMPDSGMFFILPPDVSFFVGDTLFPVIFCIHIFITKNIAQDIVTLFMPKPA
ncbi:TPA: hypothetical protein ACQJX9_002591, partial [Citrobacter farmeri]